MKYIDAEKLTELISQTEKEFTEKSKTEGYTTLEYQHKAEGLQLALQHITSLQQDQPDKSFCEENCKGYRDTGGKCFFGFDCSAKKAQEQPEVDLEKEIEQYTIGFIGELKCYKDWTPRIARFARHFYELGKNAK